jgi:hypothetical protein
VVYKYLLSFISFLYFRFSLSLSLSHSPSFALLFSCIGN